MQRAGLVPFAGLAAFQVGNCRHGTDHDNAGGRREGFAGIEAPPERLRFLVARGHFVSSKRLPSYRGFSRL